MSGLDVAIIGGGVCGLTCAVVLRKYGVNAQIYESAAQFGEIGAGLGLGPNVMDIMRDLELFDDVAAHTPEPGKLNLTGFRLVSSAEGHEHLFTYPAEPHQYGAAIHRMSLIEVLVRRIDPSQAHLGRRCVAIEPSSRNPSRSVMRFRDGTSAEADVVLVANGVKSKLREIVTGTPSGKNVSYSLTKCYRGLVVREEAKAKGVDTSFWTKPTLVMGRGKHIVIYPIRGGNLINVAAFVADYSTEIGDANRPEDAPTSEVVTAADLLAEYEDFGSDIRGVIGCIDRPLRWYINVVYPHLPSFLKGSVALMGDTAHGMLPHLYAGAGQCVEDAYLLGRLLSHPQANTTNVEEVLKVYDEIRRPRAQRVWELSCESGRVSDGLGVHGISAEGLAQDMGHLQDYVWDYVVGEDVKIATQQLKERGAFR